MKKLWRRLQASATLAVLAVVALGCIVYAATTLISVPAEVTIVNPVPVKSVAMFVDAACTIPLTKVIFASQAAPNSTWPATVYVKNIGNQPISVLVQPNPAITWGVLTGPTQAVPVAVGGSAQFNMILTIGSVVTDGTRSFNLDFYEP